MVAFRVQWCILSAYELPLLKKILIMLKE